MSRFIDETPLRAEALSSPSPEISEPKHAVINRLLARQIIQGSRLPGSKLPTESQLMREFGVSRITIRRALQDLSRDGLIVGKQGKGIYVNESEAALALNVLFVHAAETHLSHPYTAGILEGILSFGNRQTPPFRVELCAMPTALQQSPEDYTIEDRVNFGRIKGILAMPRIHNTALKRLRKLGVPVILIGGSGEGEPPEEIVMVDTDRTTPTYIQGIKHLWDIGCRKIGLIGPHSEAPGKIISNIQKEGIELNASQIEAGNWGINGGAEALERLMSRCPDLDGIHAAEDLMALGAMHQLWKKGRKIPHDVAVVGVGNFLGEASHADLTSIDIHLKAQGELASSTLLRMLEGLPIKQRNTIRPTLIQRASSSR